MKYNVVIVGGGVSGLSCALTLGSMKGHFDWAENKKFLVIDNQSSDLLKAMLNNVPGIPKGTLGKKALEDLREQAKSYGNVEIIFGRVIKVSGNKGNFTVITEDGKEFTADYVVLATGFHNFDIDCEGIEVIENKKSPRPGKVQIKVDEESRVKDGLYVAGLLAGVSTMYACAAGSGVQVACNIMAEYAGKNVVVHDVPSEN
ncbi:MAG: FAD-dependent oxidoreductase [Hydrogenothermaceae bacterium]